MMAKKGNMFLDWADDNPALAAIFGATFFIYAPARLLGRTIRAAKYGDVNLGSAPGAPTSYDAGNYTGTGASALDFLGALPQPSQKPTTGGYLFKRVYDHYAELAEKGEIPKEHVRHYATTRFNQMKRTGDYNIVTLQAPQPDQGKNPGDFYRDTGHTWKIYPDRQNIAHPIEAQREQTRGGSVAPAYTGKRYSFDGGTVPNYPGTSASTAKILGPNSVFAGLAGLNQLR